MGIDGADDLAVQALRQGNVMCLSFGAGPHGDGYVAVRPDAHRHPAIRGTGNHGLWRPGGIHLRLSDLEDEVALAVQGDAPDFDGRAGALLDATEDANSAQALADFPFVRVLRGGIVRRGHNELIGNCRFDVDGSAVAAAVVHKGAERIGRGVVLEGDAAFEGERATDVPERGALSFRVAHDGVAQDRVSFPVGVPGDDRARASLWDDDVFETNVVETRRAHIEKSQGPQPIHDEAFRPEVAEVGEAHLIQKQVVHDQRAGGRGDDGGSIRRSTDAAAVAIDGDADIFREDQVGVQRAICIERVGGRCVQDAAFGEAAGRRLRSGQLRRAVVADRARTETRAVVCPGAVNVVGGVAAEGQAAVCRERTATMHRNGPTTAVIVAKDDAVQRGRGATLNQQGAAVAPY